PSDWRGGIARALVPTAAVARPQLRMGPAHRHADRRRRGEFPRNFTNGLAEHHPAAGALLRLHHGRSDTDQAEPAGEMAAQFGADLADSALALLADAGSARADGRSERPVARGHARRVLSFLL